MPVGKLVAVLLAVVFVVMLAEPSKVLGAKDPVSALAKRELIDCTRQEIVPIPYSVYDVRLVDPASRERILVELPSFLGSNDPNVLKRRELILVYENTRGTPYSDFDFLYVVVDRESDGRYCAVQALRGPYAFNREFYNTHKVAP